MTQNRRIVILYGSQTFTAQEIAEKIWRLTKSFGFHGPVQPMDEYPITKLIEEDFVIFVCATAGQGDEPDNMKSFWKFLLKKNLPTNSLFKLKYGVLALGDSSFSKFNYVGKKLHKRLSQLGAVPLLNVGLCDYQHDLGHDAVLEPWLKNLWEQMKIYFPHLDWNNEEIDKFTFVPRWRIHLKESVCNELSESGGRLSEDIYYSKNIEQMFVDPVKLEVTDNVRTTSENHFQDVRMISLKMADGSKFNYIPGDVFNVRPRNSKETIQQLFDIFKVHNISIEPNDRLQFEQLHEDLPVPEYFREPLTVYEIAEQYWDLKAIPSKYVFSLLGHVSEDKLEQQKCLEFCTSEGQDDLLNYTKRPRRTILEALEDFHKSSAKLTIDVIFELFPMIKPRSFSTASSSKMHDGRRLELLVAVVTYYSKLKEPRLGLCSNWLKDLRASDQIYGWFKKGTFVFPKDENIPCIMIGPGTGVAPFRSFILEREALGKASDDTLVLYFGCRNEKKDFHCSEELLRLHNEKKLQVVCAFSRDHDRKIYVQHRISENAEYIWSLVSEKKAVIFMSGNSQMPNCVKEVLSEDVFQGEAGLDKEEALSLLVQLENIGQMQIETW